MLGRSPKRRSRNKPFRMPRLGGPMGRLLDPGTQYVTTIISGIVLTGFMFSGFLLFRYADSEDLLSRGKQQMYQGKIALAARTFQTLVLKNPNNYEGHLLLGKAYLELDDRWRAEREFRSAAMLRRSDGQDSSADVAMSKLAIVQKDFPKAENLLLTGMGKLRKNGNLESQEAKDLRLALFELYESWGDSLYDESGAVENKPYMDIITRYERALRYAEDYRMEDRLKEKLIQVINYYAGYLSDKQDDAHAIEVMKKSLRYRYLPETLVQIATAYERSNNLDEAIAWYRKAFEVSPSTISIKLTNILTKKGRELLDAKQPDEAQRYFNEADQVGKKANLPLDILYPVRITEFQIVSNFDESTGEIDPKVKLTLSNESDRPLSFLMVKTTFMSDDEQVAEAIETVVDPDKPMSPKTERNSKVTTTLKPKSNLNVHMLKQGQMKVVVSIAYSDGNDQVWKVKGIQEAIIRKRPHVTPQNTDDTSPPLPPA